MKREATRLPKAGRLGVKMVLGAARHWAFRAHFMVSNLWLLGGWALEEFTLNTTALRG